MRLHHVLLAPLFASVCSMAHADVTYAFQASPVSNYVGSFFTIETPDFLPYSANGVEPQEGILFNAENIDGPIGEVLFQNNTSIFVIAQNGQGEVFGGDADFTYDLSTDGVYTNPDGSTVTVTGSPTGVAATPEPSSIALLGTGVLGAAGAIRRRIA